MFEQILNYINEDAVTFKITRLDLLKRLREFLNEEIEKEIANIVTGNYLSTLEEIVKRES